MPWGPEVTANSVCPFLIARPELVRSPGQWELRTMAGREAGERSKKVVSGCGPVDSLIGYSPWLRPQLILRHGLESEQL